MTDWRVTVIVWRCHQAEDQLKLVEEQRQVDEERQKLRRQEEKRKKEEQKRILGKGTARPRLSFSLGGGGAK